MAALGLAYRTANAHMRHVISAVCLAVLILFFGLRGNVGDDYVSYHAIYERLSATDFMLMPAFSSAMWLCRAAGMTFAAFVFLTSVATNVLLLRFALQSGHNVPWVLCVFLGMSGVVNEIDFIRNAISLLLFACSIRYITERRARRFYLLNIVGIAFHYSALLYLPIYCLATRMNIRRGAFAAAIAVGCLFAFVRPALFAWLPRLSDSGSELSQHLLTYVTTYNHPLHFSVATLERLLTACAVIALYHRLQSCDSVRVAVLGFLLFFLCISIFSHYAILSTRLANIFVFSYWLLWPSIVQQLDSRRARFRVGTLMLCYMTFRLIGLGSLPAWHYTTVFD